MTTHNEQVRNVRERLYPEAAAGGYTSVDGTVQFFSRVAALTGPEDVVLDLGAGRGEHFQEDPVPFRRALHDHRSRCARVIGADIDPVVMENPSLDEAHVIGPDGLLALADESVNLIVSDYTFEHVDAPEAFAAEIDRVLKPGGWLCARTPNKFGYVSMAARLVPNTLHTKVLKRAQPGRKEEDVFPTRYRLNTRAALRDHFPPARWEHHSYTWNAEPAYFGTNALAWRAAMVLTRVLPSGMGTVLMIFLRKKG